MKLSYSLLYSTVAATTVGMASSEILTEKVLEMSTIAADLSVMAYADPTPFIVETNEEGTPTYAAAGYEEIRFYTEEPDQAIVAKKDGRCYLAFRGTNPNVDDWLQNANLEDITLFKDNDEATGESCEGRAGFSDFLATQVVTQGRIDLTNCFLSCVEHNEMVSMSNDTSLEMIEPCVVLTGHSQGGATATHASILLNRMNPTVISFGQPPAVDPGCDIIPPNESFYRFVNSIGEVNDVGFDPVPYSPTLISGSGHYGYPILLGDDDTAVYVMPEDFVPRFFDTNNAISAHSMGNTTYSYQARVHDLYKTYLANNADATEITPIPVDGFSVGVPCSRSYHQFCQTGRCSNVDFTCSVLQEDLCIKESCEEDLDCVSGKCIYGGCAAEDGLAEIDCPCRWDYQCRSGECDQSFISTDWKCWDTSAASAFSMLVTAAGIVSSALMLMGF